MSMAIRKMHYEKIDHKKNNTKISSDTKAKGYSQETENSKQLQ